MKNKITVFALSASGELANDIAEKLGTKVGKSKVHHFADGEILVEIDESVRGKDVFIVQSTSNPVTENLMEILVLADALKRASLKKLQQSFHILDMLVKIVRLNQDNQLRLN